MGVKFEKLPNGTRLIVEPNKHLNSVVTMVGVQVGSRHEPKGLHGAAHFVEHLFFKGTQRRPTSKEVGTEIESRGGHWNAFTDKELTGFHIQLAKDDGKVAVDVLHDMLENALFRDSDVEKERPVIREEISMYDDDPNTTAWEGSEAHAFAGTGLAHRITGNMQDVGFAPRALREFYRSYYVPSRTVVVLTGAVDKKVRNFARCKFGSMPERPLTGTLDPSRAGKLTPGYLFKVGKGDRLTLYFRFPAVPYTAPEAPALEILALLLGGYSTARLFQSLRENKSLCYSVSSSLFGYSDVGSIVVATSLDREKFPKALKAVAAEIKSVRSNITKDEIARAKAFQRGNMAIHFENPYYVAHDIIRQLFTEGHYESCERRVKKLMAVKRSDVVEVAREYLDPAKMHITVAGPASAQKEVTAALT